VVGLEATIPQGERVAIRAHKAVIFGSGDFSQNRELRYNFLRGPIFGGSAVASNQGDFVLIGTAAGAKLANMNNAWWSEVVLEQALATTSVSDVSRLYGDSTI